jgi:hypothetical protein
MTTIGVDLLSLTTYAKIFQILRAISHVRREDLSVRSAHSGRQQAGLARKMKNSVIPYHIFPTAQVH